MPAPPACAAGPCSPTVAPRSRPYREFAQHFPQPGWVEHDATEIWEAVKATLLDVLARLDQPVVAIGITNQRETVVAWDRTTGRPYHRAIVWQDRRTAARCDALVAAGHLPLIRERTGLVLDPYFSGTKAEWLLTSVADGGGGVPRVPELALGTIDAWLLWNLTGGQVLATDPSNASRSLLYDIGALAWDPELCDLLSVPMEALPGGPAVQRALRGDLRPVRGARRHPGVRHRRRPAGGAVRAGLLRARVVQEHLRHRQLRAHERRPRASRRRPRAC